MLHTFKDGNDGAEPEAGLLLDGGVLYGTTYRGGDRDDGGTVFTLTPTGQYSIIHRFALHLPFGQRANPEGTLVRDSAGNLFGTTLEGGPLHKGRVYELSASGQVTILHTFIGGSDGQFPHAGLLRDAAGNLYGTTEAGGNSFCEGGGCGTVFKIDRGNKESVLYAFVGGNADGNDPYGGLVRDRQGNLYGTTMGGGTSNCVGEGCGIVFKIDAKGHETILHRFTEGADGGHPAGTLLQGSDGSFYGTTDSGGKVDAGGTVFKIDKTAKETVLYNFIGGSDGAGPFGDLSRRCGRQSFWNDRIRWRESALQWWMRYGVRARFERSRNGTLSVYGKQDGASPLAGVTIDAAGYLYGTTPDGGDRKCANGLGCGVAFKLKL